MPVHDPDVKDAASYAVKFIAQKSNSLFPYQLLEIVLAKAKVGSSSLNSVDHIPVFKCAISLLLIITYLHRSSFVSTVFGSC